MVGGEHERWALPGDEEDGEEGEAGQRRRKEQQGDVPKVRALLCLSCGLCKERPEAGVHSFSEEW